MDKPNLRLWLGLAAFVVGFIEWGIITRLFWPQLWSMALGAVSVVLYMIIMVINILASFAITDALTKR